MIVKNRSDKAAFHGFRRNRLSTSLLAVVAVLFTSLGVVTANAGTAKTSTQISITATPATVVAGTPVTLKATVSPKSGSTTPTGTVNFVVDGISLGILTLSNGSITLTVPTVGVPAGTYVIGGNYGGNNSNQGSSSAASVVVNNRSIPRTTTVVTASASSVTIGQPVTLQARVSASSGPTPTGTVNFMVGTTKLGSGSVSNGVASFVVSTTGIAAGSYPVVAQYGGSSNNKSSNSSALSIAVNAQSSGATGTALSSCGDLTTSGTYYLSGDVSSSGTCFFIDADNIALNLNGHTITYGTGGGSASTPGILLADNWYTAPAYSLAQTGTTLKHGGFSLYGGNITSAANAAPRSAALWVGESNDITPAPVVHDVVMTTHSADASPIFGTVSVSGWQIYNNTINYASTTTTSRYNFWGYAVWLGDELNAPGATPDQIYNNKIIGAPQGGIMDDHQNALIHNNDITFNSFYANDYCVITYSGDNQVVSNNNCHPTSGRGIDMEARGGQVTGNTITVTELSQDAEYGGCEEGGTDGIRIRDNTTLNNAPSAPTGVVVSGNVITSTAEVCEAVGLRLSYLMAGDIISFANNTVTTTGPGTSALPDYSVSFEGDVSPVLTFSNNSLKSTYAFIGVDWDGANVIMNGAQNWMNTPMMNIDNENGYNDQGENGPTFSQAVIVDALSGGKIKCGSYAAGVTQFGTTSQTCN